MADSKKKKVSADVGVNVYIPATGETKQVKCNMEVAGAKPAKTVTVALCHPHGIQFILGKRRVVLNGNAANLAGLPKGSLPLGGYGLTVIDADDWAEIKRVYGNMEIFKNGLCFAHEARNDTLSEADEKAELRHGLEPVVVEGAGKQSNTESVDAAML